MVARLQVVLVNIGVVYAVDAHVSQGIVGNRVARLIMFEAKTFEKIHVDNRCSGRHNAVDHVVPQQVGIEVHAASS